MDYLTFYISKPERSSLEIIGELFMIKAKKVQNGGMNIVY